MISRSNYIAITMIMCVVLLMFQLTGISENVLMSSGENIFGEEAAEKSLISLEKHRNESRTDRLSLTADEAGRDTVGLVGDEGKACLDIGRAWCQAQIRSFCYYGDLAEAAADEDGAGFLIVDGTSLAGEQDVRALDKLSEQGRHVAVSGLPAFGSAKSGEELMDRLGIYGIAEERVSTDALRLFAGLLPGGETTYTDYKRTIPWVKLGDSVKAFAVAKPEGHDAAETENEDLPAVIWRYTPDRGNVYVVNGDYLETQPGAGLLTGFAADADEICIYPTANAQISVVENYPILADENPEVMENEYGQASSVVFRDILWSSVVAVSYDTGDALTVTASPRLDYTEQGEINESLLDFYYEQMTKETGEIGLSGYQVSDVPLSEKLEEDLVVFGKELPDYKIYTFQAGGLDESEYEHLVGEGRLLEDVNTVLTDYDGDSREPFFSCLDNGVLKLPVYMDSRVMEGEDDFRSRCLQTAYGYYGTAIDTSKVVYPESDEDHWNIISNEWSKNYRPYRTPFEVFEKTTATEADRRVRNYLALDYETRIGEDTVEITADSPDGESYYVMHVNGRTVGDITGGTCEEIEPGWYLVTVEDETARISLEEPVHAEYYIE